MLTLLALLAATPTFGPDDRQLLLKVGGPDGWAQLDYLGESADGKVALVIEQGEHGAGSELKITFLIADSTGKTAPEKIVWSTTEGDALDPDLAWKARGAQLHQALERAGVKAGFKRFSADEAKKPKGLNIVYGDPSAAGPVKVKLGGKDWFETRPLDKARLEWKGALTTSKGVLQLFLLQRLGNGAGPEYDYLAEALPIAGG
ncbi:MAG: hypothetical protein QM723_01055 [Myxococcaceae bacterium]